MKKLRTFIAHPVPLEWRKVVSGSYEQLQAGLKSRIAWVKPENMHLTLKFLGDIEESQLPDIHAALNSIRFTPYEISSAAAGFFPQSGKPRILWRGLEKGAAELCGYAAAIDGVLHQLGFSKNEKECHAHLTLGRIKKQAADDWPVLAQRAGGIELCPATISGFALYQSVLTPDGPVYSVLQEYAG